MTATCWARTLRDASVLALVVAGGLGPAAHAAPLRLPPPLVAPSFLRAAPLCSAGGPYTSQCDGVTLSGATASDPDGDPLTFLWESDCDADGVFGEAVDGSFDDETLLSAVFHAPAPCGSTCALRLTVADANPRGCVSTTTVTVNDTAPPVIDFGGTLALGPADTYFPRTQGGAPMQHSHGMVYERPQLTVWWTDYELPENVYEFDATLLNSKLSVAKAAVAVYEAKVKEAGEFVKQHEEQVKFVAENANRPSDSPVMRSRPSATPRVASTSTMDPVWIGLLNVHVIAAACVPSGNASSPSPSSAFRITWMPCATAPPN